MFLKPRICFYKMKEYNVSTFEIFLMETPHDLLPEVLIKLKKKAIGRKSYYNNWEKRKKDREDNAERRRESKRKWNKDNKERVNEKNRKWRVDNEEKSLKSRKKGSWKRRGLNMEHFEEIYEIYMITTHCDFCEVELTEDKIITKTSKCMDHSHITGEFRNVLCHSCNSSLPKWT